MTVYVGLLRAVNASANGKVLMKDLKGMCEREGFEAVRTFIASGNVVFESAKSEAQIKAALDAQLLAYVNKPIGVLVRTADELAHVLASNPFPHAPRNKTVAIFLDGAPPPDVLARITGERGEIVRLGKREVYVNYVNGIGRSKLKIPGTENGTARNMNTIAKLVEMAGNNGRG